MFQKKIKGFLYTFATISIAILGLVTISSESKAFFGFGKKHEGHKKSNHMEKCAGIVKAGQNDCKSTLGNFSCSGHSTKDNQKDAWILLPKGTCDRIANAVVVKK